MKSQFQPPPSALAASDALSGTHAAAATSKALHGHPEAIPLFQRPDGRPLPDDHHLAIGSRGKFTIRATIDQGSGFVGERITVQTGTSDLVLARLIRDAVVMAWIKAGVLTRKVVLTDA